MRALLPVFTALLLAGCVTNPQSCDPTTGDVNIVTKFNCNYSGTWDQRVTEKQQTLQHEQALNKEFNAVYAAIEQEKTQSNASVTAKRKSQQELQRSMNNLVAQLKKKSAGRADAQKEIAALEKSMKEAQNRPSESEMQKQMELQKLQGQLTGLQKMLEPQ
ncbi:hypothetical protein [Pectobacterium wasabiae]|uniref:Lipoprotein n=1 Tax=Pectobacterium wasabiae TaxID=55208 RepID=A0AAW3EE63_9GAMM|nr:hypothetical protein [Pectobacterium wasabiae]AOR63655.1 hypothetical protein A7983_10355 [Pectobacterium wasabiae CFBP 3304]EJS94680.1 Hypothetical protein Y17_2176 [Pectobacterium wasabiae CFBP 3304]KFX03336.1 hypothetical protein JV38_19130 [Pectobacterium wasabiae]KGA26303.1 hypothetical protein KU73_22075 [Pectobacterium wasabiae]